MSYLVQVSFGGLCAIVRHPTAERMRSLLVAQPLNRRASDGKYIEPHQPTIELRWTQQLEDGCPHCSLRPNYASKVADKVIYYLNRDDVTLEANWAQGPSSDQAAKPKKAEARTYKEGDLLRMDDLHAGSGRADAACFRPDPPDVIAARVSFPSRQVEPAEPNQYAWKCYSLLAGGGCGHEFAGPANYARVTKVVESGPVTIVAHDMTRRAAVKWCVRVDPPEPPAPGAPEPIVEVWVDALEERESRFRDRRNPGRYLLPHRASEERKIAREYEAFYDICLTPPSSRPVPHETRRLGGEIRSHCMALMFDDHAEA